MSTKIGLEEIPVINIMSKIDLLKKLGRPQMNLIDLENLSGVGYLFWGMDGDYEESDEDEDKKRKRLNELNQPYKNCKNFNLKYGKLSKSLCELIENYMGFSGYLLLDITSRELMCHIIGQIDKQNGYFEQPEKSKNKREAAIDYQAIEMYVQTEAVQEIYDKYIDLDEVQ